MVYPDPPELSGEVEREADWGPTPESLGEAAAANLAHDALVVAILWNVKPRLLVANFIRLPAQPFFAGNPFLQKR